MGEVLRKKYGDQLSMRYVDVIEDNMDLYPGVEEYISKAGMKLPIIVINDRIIHSVAGLNYMEIEEEIEEMRGKKL